MKPFVRGRRQLLREMKNWSQQSLTYFNQVSEHYAQQIRENHGKVGTEKMVNHLYALQLRSVGRCDMLMDISKMVTEMLENPQNGKEETDGKTEENQKEGH